MNGKAVREAYTGQADEEMSYADIDIRSLHAPFRRYDRPYDEPINRAVLPLHAIA